MKQRYPDWALKLLAYGLYAALAWKLGEWLWQWGKGFFN